MDAIDSHAIRQDVERLEAARRLGPKAYARTYAELLVLRGGQSLDGLRRAGSKHDGRRHLDRKATAKAIQAGLDYLTEARHFLAPLEAVLLMSLRPGRDMGYCLGCSEIPCTERRVLVDLAQFLDSWGRQRLRSPLRRMVRVLDAEPRWRDQIGRCLVCPRWYVDTSPGERRQACDNHADLAQKSRARLKKRLQSSPPKLA